MRGSTLRHLLIGAVLALSTAAAGPAQTRPNVLFVIADDLTAEALSCYGNRQCRTPAIDGLAARGVRFSRAYCQFPICGPSRAALMAGAYPRTIGVMGNGGAARLTAKLGDRPTLPLLFKDAGWHTARVSKIFHMRVPGDITAGVPGPDHAASWTERFDIRAPEWQTDGHAEHLTREKLRFEPDAHYDLGFGAAFYVVEGDGDGSEQADFQAADRAIDLLGKLGDEPFFLAVGFVRPHVPLVAPAACFAPYDAEGILLPDVPPGDRDDIPSLGISRSSEPTGLTDAAKKRRVLRAYYAAVAFMDAQVGRVLDALEEHEHADDTIVVFTSDHGYHLGEHDLWQKMSLHEESARIPLVIAAPGRPAGVRDALAEQIDLYPTLAELAGLEVPAHVEGRSLVPVLDDPSARVRDVARATNGHGELVRTERWALLAWKDGTAELYDMERDPRQLTNLADDPDHAEIRAALTEHLGPR